MPPAELWLLGLERVLFSMPRYSPCLASEDGLRSRTMKSTRTLFLMAMCTPPRVGRPSIRGPNGYRPAKTRVSLWRCGALLSVSAGGEIERENLGCSGRKVL